MALDISLMGPAGKRIPALNGKATIETIHGLGQGTLDLTANFVLELVERVLTMGEGKGIGYS